MFSDSEIIDAFERLEYDAQLPREAPFSIFYEQLADMGYSLFVMDGERYGLYCVETEDVIDIMAHREIKLFIISEEDKTILSLAYQNGNENIIIHFPFDHRDEKQRNFLRMVRVRREISVHFLDYLYGGLVKTATKSFTLPAGEAASIPEFT